MCSRNGVRKEVSDNGHCHDFDHRDYCIFCGCQKWGDNCDNISSIACRRCWLEKFGLASRDAPILHASWTPFFVIRPHTSVLDPSEGCIIARLRGAADRRVQFPSRRSVRGPRLGRCNSHSLPFQWLETNYAKDLTNPCFHFWVHPGVYMRMVQLLALEIFGVFS